MASTAGVLELSWQGAAGRKPERFLVVRLRSATAESGGLFGLRRSPAMPGWMPDAQIVVGEVAAGPEVGQEVHLRLPGAELGAMQSGELLALGIVDTQHCICLLRPLAGMQPDAALAWASTQSCG